MLIEFCVQNHRAIRERQTLSMIPIEADDMHRLDFWPYHVAKTTHPAVPGVLIDACIFGANGSGKSSLVAAMEFMAEFVRGSADGSPDAKIPVDPFIFDPYWTDRPSEFEATFLVGTTAYRYGFEVTRDRVVGESLTVLAARSERWSAPIEREHCPKSGRDVLKIGKSLRNAGVDWASQTPSNALLLSAAARLGIGGYVETAYKWLTEHFCTLRASNAKAGLARTTERLCDEASKRKTLEFFRDFGISLRDVKVRKRRAAGSSASAIHAKRSGTPAQGRAAGVGRSAIRLLHGTDLYGGGEPAQATVSLASEAAGVQTLFNLAGPVLDALEQGATLVLDEINLGLHPHAVECLISMFCKSETNKKRAQIIFTTYDPNIVGMTYVERDQVWIMEMKDCDRAAKLLPLPHIKGRDALASFTEDYLSHRYGATPEVRRQV